MISPRHLSLRTKQATCTLKTYVRSERGTLKKDDNMSITRSIRVVQTENKVLEEGCLRDKQCVSHLCHFLAIAK